MITRRWNEGDQIGKLELIDWLVSHDFCAPGTDFYKKYLDPMKQSTASDISNWFSTVLERHGYSIRKTSIGQTVPKH